MPRLSTEKGRKYPIREAKPFSKVRDYSQMWLLEVTASDDGMPIEPWQERICVKDCPTIQIALRRIRGKLPYSMLHLGAEFYEIGDNKIARLLPWLPEHDGFLLKGGCDVII